MTIFIYIRKSFITKFVETVNTLKVYFRWISFVSKQNRIPLKLIIDNKGPDNFKKTIERV